MGALIVSYPASEGARFDRDYYLGTHMPLVERVFGPHGLMGATAYFSDDPDGPSLAVATLTFRDGDARDAALGHSDAAQAFDDIANFTNVRPVAQRLSAR